MSALDFRQDLRILVLFLIVQFAGLLLMTQLFNGAAVYQISAASAPGSSILFPLIYVVFIIIFSAIMLILIRRSASKIFIVLEGFAIFVSSYVFFLILFVIVSSYAPQIQVLGNQGFQLIASGILAFTVLIIKNKVPRSRNTVSIMVSVAIGLIIGSSLSFPIAYLFMIIIAVYDFIAVFVTKHMVAMGQAAVEMNLAFLVMTSEGEAVPAKGMTKSQQEAYSKSKPAFSRYRDTTRKLKEEGLVPILRPRALGNGDLAMPLMVAVSAYAQFLSVIASLVVVVGAAFGLILTFFILDKYKRPLPAIPPLLFGISIALLIYFISTGVLRF